MRKLVGGDAEWTSTDQNGNAIGGTYGQIMPSIFYIKDKSKYNVRYKNNGRGFTEHPDCTASLVGPNIILTAAHCVHLEKNINPEIPENEIPETLENEIQFNNNGKIIPFVCTRHPKYNYGTPTYDIAICQMRYEQNLTSLLTTSRQFPAEVIGSTAHENIGGYSTSLTKRLPVMMTGTGCEKERVYSPRKDASTSPPTNHQQVSSSYLGVVEEGNAPTDMLKVGASKVTAVQPHSSKPEWPGHIEITSRFPNIMTYPRDKSSKPEVKLCYGDSGGPLLVNTDDYGLLRRRIIGVNATKTALISSDPDNVVQINSFVTFENPEVRLFIDTYVKNDRSVNICGINLQDQTIDPLNKQCAK